MFSDSCQNLVLKYHNCEVCDVNIIIFSSISPFNTSRIIAANHLYNVSITPTSIYLETASLLTPY